MWNKITELLKITKKKFKMKKKTYAFGSAPREEDQLRPMINRVASSLNEIIGNTLGPGGRNYMTPLGITNDGVSILREIRFEDEREDAIASAFEEVARRQDADAGDGTTTATTFATALTPIVLQDVCDIKVPIPGMKTVMEIKAQLEAECAAAITLLEEQKTPVTTEEDLLMVAKTAMENHPSSSIIANTVFQIGYNSNIMLEEGFNEEVTVDIVPGIHYPLKIETPAMYTNLTRREAVYENPIVIVANHIFEAYADISKFMEGYIAHVQQHKTRFQPIVIIAKQFSIPFTAQIVSTMRQMEAQKMPVKFLLLSAKSLRDEEFMDIVEYINGTYVDTHPKEGVTPTQIEFKHAGSTKKIVAGPKQTSLTGGDGIEAGRVSIRVEELKKLTTTETNPEERKLLERRAAGLQGGVATIYVDAKTAVDRYYLKKKVEDAVNSCKSALEHGTVAGGGLSYLDVATKLPDGYLKKLLPVIHERIMQNAGSSLTIDPLQVRDAFYTNKTALQNAVAVVKILVTMEGVIEDVEHSMVEELKKSLGYEWSNSETRQTWNSP